MASIHKTLRETLGRGALSGPVGRAVIAAAFGFAGAAPDGAHVFGLHHDFHRLQAAGKIAAHRGKNDDEHRVMNAMQPQLWVVGEQEGTDIQGRARRSGHPALVQRDQRADGLQGIIRVQLGQPQPVTGAIQPGYVFPGTEQLHPSVRTTVSLQPFKTSVP